MNVEIILLIPLCYLLGSIPSGYLLGKWFKGIDLREVGSGSTGTTNVLRNVGRLPAFIVFTIDVLKGAAAVLIAKFLELNDWVQVFAGLAAIFGHIWSIWINGKGGKAVATGFGMFLGLNFTVGLASLGIFLLMITFSKIVSLSSLVATTTLPILMILTKGSISYITISIIALIIIFWKHRDNIKRLISGKEPNLKNKID